MQNLQELPRFGDKLSYLYVEHAVIDQHEKSIAVHRADQVTPVPAAALALLILGPGTTITHAAVKALADDNCQVVWVGEHAVRFYAHGLGGSRHSRNLLRQARLVSNDVTRLQVVIRMYAFRFTERLDPGLTLQQIRGKEGIRVRQAYAEASRETGVVWAGRNYQRNEWSAADPVNRALSSANACLYGLVHAAIISGGYSPAMGFVHTGKQLSFVYDVADLYKADLTIPLAFRAVAAGTTDIERNVRIACREAFRTGRLIEQILPDIEEVLKVPDAGEDEFADDPAKPGEYWTPRCLTEDMPISRVLKLDPDTLPKRKGTTRHDSDDSGTGDTVSAG